jgi:signal transduction histidine kinase/ligand-binding sensor domain-containing protein
MIAVGVLLPFLCLSVLVAQTARPIAQYMHTAWGEREGAPAGIFAMAQTTDSYLWLASDDGLVRFDGITFEHYRPQTIQLTEGAVFKFDLPMSLLALPNGDLWAGDASGALLMLRNGKGRYYGPQDGVLRANVRFLAQDRNGTIWAATRLGLERLEGERWKQVGADWNFPQEPAAALFVDHEGTLWVSTQDSLLFLKAGSRKFQPTGLQLGEVTGFAEQANGRLWMAETTNNWVRTVPVSDKRSPPDDRRVEAGSEQFLFDHNGELWMSNVGFGVRHVASPDLLKGATHFPNAAIDSFTTKDGLTDDQARCILEDRQHNFWVATNSGLDRFRKTDLAPVVFPDHIDHADSTLIAGDAGDVWLGNGNSLMRIHEGQVDTKPPLARDVTSAYRDSAGALWWIGGGGIYSLHGGSYIRRSMPPSLPKDYFSQYVAAVEDKSGALWLFARGQGSFYWKAGRWQQIDAPPELNLHGPTSAYLDPNGRVWVGYAEGAIAIIDHTRIERIFRIDDIPSAGVNAIYAHGPHLWVIGGGGVSFFDGSGFQRLAPFDARRFFMACGVNEAADGSLWFCENRGVIQIPATEVSHFLSDYSYRVKYRLFDAADGLVGVFKGLNRSLRQAEGTDGKLWFATSRNLLWLDPSHLNPPDTVPPPVVIRSFGASGAPVQSLENLKLPARTTDVQIGYTALDLSFPGKLHFKYLLSGVDKNWQDAGTRREAFYTRLGPGKYHFRVIACNRDGAWNEVGAGLDFSIAPAWFQTNWFYALCVCAFLLLLSLLYQLRLRQLKAQFDAAIKMRVDERTRIARELHDTLLQSVQGAAFQLQAARKLLIRKSDNAMDVLDDAIDTTKNAIKEGRIAVRDLRPEEAAKRSLGDLLKDAGHELAAVQALDGTVPDYQVVIEGIQRALSPMLQDEVYRISREVIRNAFTHAAANRIEVEMRYDDDQLRVRVRDDGKGIEREIVEAGRQGHWGVSGMRERALRIGAQLDFWSKVGAGTEIQLTIPAAMAYEKRPVRALSLFHAVWNKNRHP